DISEENQETYGIIVPDLPTSLITAMETYFLDINDGLYVVGVLNDAVANILKTGTFVNTTSAYCALDDATLKAALTIIQNYYNQDVFED
ncbi:MAG: hypothetical protein PHQ30_04485, partial [Candidatus Izemoplasmatales bacterium]|nr:hypothetical protein [Candidatus Izemoplasmatales bacterium]